MNLYQLSVSQLTYLETGQFIIRFITDFESKNLDPASDAEFHDAVQNHRALQNE